MPNIEVSPSELRQIWREDHPNYEMEEDTSWEDEGKYQYCYPVVKNVASGKFYSFCVQRSGSYFTDYDFDFPDNRLTEVQKVKKVVETEEWVAV